MALLGASYPMEPMDDSMNDQIKTMKLSACQMICGIVEHAKDRLVFAPRLLSFTG